MAWLNDSAPPAGSSWKGKEPARTEPTKQNTLDEHEPVEPTLQVNQTEQRTSTLIEGDENDQEQIEITHEEFLKECQERLEWLYEKTLQMHEQYNDELHVWENHLANAVSTRQARAMEMAQLQEQIDELEEHLNLASVDCDAYANWLAWDLLNPGHHVATERTEWPSSHKSAKIPDPPLLTDGKEPQFEDWLLLMTQKLDANHDHYNSPQLCHAYMASWCDGKAWKHITPHLWSEAINPYHDSDDMIEHLKTIYEDPNQITTAKNQFQQLYMKSNDRFHDFLSEFLYLAAEASISDDDLKDELYHHLTTKLQELTIAEINSTDGTFHQFTTFCSQTASCLEVMNHHIQKNHSFQSNQQCEDGKTTSRSMTPAIKKEPGSSLSSSNINWAQLMHEGKCFNCQEHSHLSVDCPKKQKSELKELEHPKESDAQNNLENI